MDPRETFADEGSITFYRGVSEDQADYWRSMACHSNTWSNVIVGKAAEDDGRVKTPVTDKASRTMTLWLERFSKTFIPNSEAKDWCWIKTLAGMPEAPPRRDFASVGQGGDFTNTGAIPGGIVVALDHNTCFYVYGWNHSVARRSNRDLIRLKKGDVFVYRGDLIYAPVGYDTNNVYLHAFLETAKGQVRDDHQPEFVQAVDNHIDPGDLFCFAWNCTFHGHDIQALHRHLTRYHGFRFHQAPHVVT